MRSGWEWQLPRYPTDFRTNSIHENLAGKVVRGGGNRPVGTLAQRRVGRQIARPLVRDLVGRLQSRGAGVVVGEVPGRDQAVGGSGDAGQWISRQSGDSGDASRACTARRYGPQGKGNV